MIDLDVEEVVFVVKIIDLNTEVSVEKAMVVLVFEIDDSNSHTAMALMN